MKTKSESNLAQRFDFVAVDIPLDGEPEQEKDKENETQTTEDKKDEPVKQDEGPPHPVKEEGGQVFLKRV